MQILITFVVGLIGIIVAVRAALEDRYVVFFIALLCWLLCAIRLFLASRAQPHEPPPADEQPRRAA